MTKQSRTLWIPHTSHSRQTCQTQVIKTILHEINFLLQATEINTFLMQDFKIYIFRVELKNTLQQDSQTGGGAAAAKKNGPQLFFFFREEMKTSQQTTKFHIKKKSLRLICDIQINPIFKAYA